jgi:hypothetical protein
MILTVMRKNNNIIFTCDILGGGGTCGGSSDFSVSCNGWLNTFSNEGNSVLMLNGAT